MKVLIVIFLFLLFTSLHLTFCFFCPSLTMGSPYSQYFSTDYANFATQLNSTFIQNMCTFPVGLPAERKLLESGGNTFTFGIIRSEDWFLSSRDGTRFTSNSVVLFGDLGGGIYLVLAFCFILATSRHKYCYDPRDVEEEEEQDFVPKELIKEPVDDITTLNSLVSSTPVKREDNEVEMVAETV
jgi:hypothetical protein